MGVFDAVVGPVDNALTGLFGQWNAYSTAIVTTLVVVVSYYMMNMSDPDTHPGLLARQASPSRVRQEGESATYRSRYIPESMPLTTGLNVKDAGASKWSRGRDGDLRDIWKRAVTGGSQDDGPVAGKTGRILTVLGTQNIIEHSLDDITRQINLIGQHISQQGGSRVALYLPNSIELIATLFACSFHDLTPIILPFDQPDEHVIDMLRRSAADTVVTAPGSFPFDSVVQAYPALRQLIWVVDEGNKHLDWNEVPKGMGSSVNVSTWSDILCDSPADAKTAVPERSDKQPKPIVTFWAYKSGETEEMVEFTHGNIASGIAGQLSAIPSVDRFSPSDLFLPADPLANIHTLVLTLAALYSNASVAFNSVAGGSDDIVLATQGIAPTVLVAPPAMLLKAHEEMMDKIGALPRKVIHGFQSRSLSQYGVMPGASSNDSLRPAIGTTPGKLRLVFVAERAGAGTKPLSSSVLSGMRIFTGARIVYALSAAKVAGAVTQTHVHDYRVHQDGEYSHFGCPLVCTEFMLRDQGYHMTTDSKAEGEIIVRGPCVSGGEASVGEVGKIREDYTLGYAENSG
ncbi:AMP-dependent synthetase/ligase [Zalerion maritima]|uniref:AMP-dependent synthetase/ligase n=1 Tax=Zalerion maritima TaxID=339359 RepID=A0AAD5RFW6_9PEZI|nr:AMP-dependent synthetase/ligase [Zalerion maritima]